MHWVSVLDHEKPKVLRERIMLGTSRIKLFQSTLFLPLCIGLSSCGGGGDVEEVMDKALGRVTWTNIASEGQTFTFKVAGTYTVRFGANGVWVQKSIVNAGACSVANFGSDPAPGVLKSCQVRGSATVTVSGSPGLTSTAPTSTTTSTSTTSTSTSTAPWTNFTTEGVSFSTSQAATIRYGTATQFVEKSVTGAYLCGNSAFGSDPAPGVLKSCWAQDTAIVSAAPSATWSAFAGEGASFNSTKTLLLRYGTSSQFAEMSVSGAGTCSNTFFGKDPAPGVLKSCFTQDAAAITVSGTSATTTSTATTSTTTSSTTTNTSVSSTGTASADGSVTAVLSATRTTGPAPLAVMFDASGTTVTSGIAFHGLKYAFNFGDERGQTWAVSGLPKNTQTGGPIAGHVFDVPGTYTVRVTASSASGATSTASVTVTVQDPNSVYAGLATVCVSAVSDYSGCPTGASTSTALPTTYAGKRVLLRRGESFGQVTIRHTDDNVMVGAYGTGTKPNVQRVAISEGGPPSAGTFADDIVVMDLNILTNLSQSGSAARHLYYRNDLVTMGGSTGITFAAALGYYVRTSSYPAVSFYQPREIFIVENRVVATTSQSTPILLLQGGGSRIGVMGNEMGVAPQHSARLWMAHKSFIGHNALRGISSDGIRHSLKMHSGGTLPYSDSMDLASWGSTQNNGMLTTSQVVIANNLFGDSQDNNRWTVETGPQNTSQPEGLEDVIAENNRFLRGVNTSAEIVMTGRRMTARGNTRVDGQSPVISVGPTNTVLAADWNSPYWFSATWTIAGLDQEGDLNLLPPTASGTRLDWLLNSGSSAYPVLELSADPSIDSDSTGITYVVSLSEEAPTNMQVTLSNGAVIRINSGERIGSVVMPIVRSDTALQPVSQTIQVYVTKVEGGGFARLAISDSNVITNVSSSDSERAPAPKN